MSCSPKSTELLRLCLQTQVVPTRSTILCDRDDLLQSWRGLSGPTAAPPVERAYKLASSTAACRLPGVTDDNGGGDDDDDFNRIRQRAPASVVPEIQA